MNNTHSSMITMPIIEYFETADLEGKTSAELTDGLIDYLRMSFLKIEPDHEIPIRSFKNALHGLINEMREDLFQVIKNPDYYRSNVVDVLKLFVRTLETIDLFLAKSPTYETPEQYKERTGKEWPDRNAVYALHGEDGKKYYCPSSYMLAKRGKRKIIICATEAGCPPDDYLPENY